MTRVVATPLHIEWTPHWVRAVNIATGQTSGAPTLRELGPILSGHRDVIAGIGRSSVFLKTLRLPRAEPDDLRRILEVQLGQNFPLPANELSFDFIQTTDQTVEGLLTMVAAIRAEDLRRIREDLGEAGLTAQRILPVALGSAALAVRDHNPTALVVEASPNGLGLDVVDKGVVVYSRVAPIGGAPIEEARRTMAAAHALAAPIITVGVVDIPEGVSSVNTPLNLLSEAPAFTFTLTEDRRLEAAKRVSARMRLAVLMALSAILLLALVWSDRQEQQAAVARTQGAWTSWLTTHRSIADTETAKASKVVDIQYNVDRAFEPGQRLSDITSVVTDSLPPGAWLTGLTVERGKPLQIRGTAKSGDDIARFVDTLGANPRFRNVTLGFANSALVGKIPVVQFNVSAICVGNLPMPAPTKTTSRGTHSATATTTSGGTGAGS